MSFTLLMPDEFSHHWVLEWITPLTDQISAINAAEKRIRHLDTALFMEEIFQSIFLVKTKHTLSV